MKRISKKRKEIFSKVDLENEREVVKIDADKMADTYNLKHIEVSTKSNIDVELPFEYIINQYSIKNRILRFTQNI